MVIRSSKNDIIEEQTRIKDVDTISIEQKERILSWLKNIGASYMGEISWESNISEYECKNLLNILWKEGYIEPINVSYDIPDHRLLLRVPEMSAKGQGGFDAFSRKKWFGITAKGRYWLKNTRVIA